ncbi:MAG: xanthine dehydrogenase family protein subunit M, partial [Burkholderiales bacterium]
PMASAAREDECLEEIRWPVWAERRTGSAFTEISIRHGDFALVAAAAQIALGENGRCTRAALGLGGVGQTPLAFPKLAARLVGTRLEEKIVEEIAHDAAAETGPSGDLHATADYRRHLARVLADRALREAHEKAKAAR